MNPEAPANQGVVVAVRGSVVDVRFAHHLPEVPGGPTATLRALLREQLFISLYRACAESLASGGGPDGFLSGHARRDAPAHMHRGIQFTLRPWA